MKNIITRAETGGNPASESPVHICRRCGSDHLVNVPADPPHYQRTICWECRAFVRWTAHPITLPRARFFRLWFGRHAGKRLAEVPRDYLRWLVATFAEDPQQSKRTLAALARLVLDEAEAEEGGGR